MPGQEVHAAADVCAVSALYLPASQLVHAAAEMAVLLNVPATQAATVEPSPVYPADALQSFSASDAAALAVLAGQSSHVSDG